MRLPPVNVQASGTPHFFINGRRLVGAQPYEKFQKIIDEEINTLLTNAHQEAFDILEKNRDVLDSLVLELLDKETLDKEQIAQIFVPLRRSAMTAKTAVASSGAASSRA